MLETEYPCYECGHPRHTHTPVAIAGFIRVRNDGTMHEGYYRHGPCAHTEQYSRGFYTCYCREYTPDPHPHVTELLGRLNVRDMEKVVGYAHRVYRDEDE